MEVDLWVGWRLLSPAGATGVDCGCQAVTGRQSTFSAQNRLERPSQPRQKRDPALISNLQKKNSQHPSKFPHRRNLTSFHTVWVVFACVTNLSVLAEGT